ncbi:MAG: SgcJ/EcaC family oxidoreductase [Isosphaeraceae bacterium]
MIDSGKMYSAFSVLFLALAGAAPADDRVGADAVKALLDTQVAAWNRKDLDGFLETFWHSPEVVFQSGGTRTDGFDAVRERYRKRYQAEGRAMGTLTFTGIEVVMLGPDAALARGRWGLVMPGGETPNGLFTLLIRKKPEGWRIVHDHTSS